MNKEKARAVGRLIKTNGYILITDGSSEVNLRMKRPNKMADYVEVAAKRSALTFFINALNNALVEFDKEASETFGIPNPTAPKAKAKSSAKQNGKAWVKPAPKSKKTK